MRLEDRIRNELHDTAERLALDPGEYRRAIEAAQGRRRRLLAAGIGGATVVAALVATAVVIRPGAEPDIAASSTTSDQQVATTAVAEPLPQDAVVLTGPDGLFVRVVAGGEGFILTSDPYYEAISFAVGDGQGGLVYTHAVTPVPWEQGTLMWLPAGETSPRPVVAPPPQALITPIGTEAGIVYYRLDHLGGSEIYAVPLTGGNPNVVVPATSQLVGASLAGGTLAVAYGGDCGGIDFYTTDGDKLTRPAWVPECLISPVVDLAFTDDYLFTVEDGDEGRVLRRTDYLTGESIDHPIEAWQVEALTSKLVAVGGDAVQIGDFSGHSFEVLAEEVNSGSFALVAEVALSPDAKMGSGLAELPCTPLEVPPPAPQEVPDPVESKRQAIFAAASNCDLGALAEIVLTDEAVFTFGDETDPVRAWVREARFGNDPMAMTVRMLNAEPALGPEGVWAWPAVHVTGSEEDWQALSGILSAAEFEQFYQFRDSGYLGMRIGIEPEGRLVYLVAGD